MAALATVDRPASRASAGAGSGATPRSRLRLATLDDVARELGRLYRRVDRGELPSAEGTRRAYMLTTLAKVIEASVIETRLNELEGIAHELEASRGT